MTESKRQSSGTWKIRGGGKDCWEDSAECRVKSEEKKEVRFARKARLRCQLSAWPV